MGSGTVIKALMCLTEFVYYISGVFKPEVRSPAGPKPAGGLCRAEPALSMQALPPAVSARRGDPGTGAGPSAPDAEASARVFGQGRGNDGGGREGDAQEGPEGRRRCRGEAGDSLARSLG